jgi:hypothetical protein
VEEGDDRDQQWVFLERLGEGAQVYRDEFGPKAGGSTQITNEVLQDDGTYGTSMDYLYWFDSKGTFHQHYVGGGQIVHISSEPLAIKNVVLNMELSDKDAQTEAK